MKVAKVGLQRADIGSRFCTKVYSFQNWQFIQHEKQSEASTDSMKWCISCNQWCFRGRHSWAVSSSDTSDAQASMPNFMYHDSTSLSTGSIKSRSPPLPQFFIFLSDAEHSYDFRGVFHLWFDVKWFWTVMYDYSQYSNFITRQNRRQDTAHSRVSTEASSKSP